jgi:sugar O-acyltransferase (sialic acid O-acetyltransferase NeuD family)
MNKPLIIMGAGGHALSCTDVISDAGLEIAGFVTKSEPSPYIRDRWPVYSNLEMIQKISNFNIFIAIGDNGARWRCRHYELGRYPDDIFPSIIHPNASVSPYVDMGPGCIIMNRAHIGPYSEIAGFNIVNTAAVVEHECVMDEFSSLAPCAALGGNAKVGRRSAICISATVIHCQLVGEDSVVGASSLVNQEVPSNTLGYGIPFKVIRSRSTHDYYL